MLALEWSDITPDGITINKQIGYSNTFESGKRIKTERTTDSAPKSKSSARLVPITEDLRRILDAYRKQQKAEAMANGYKTTLIFTTKSGGKSSGNSFRSRLTIPPHYARTRAGVNRRWDGRERRLALGGSLPSPEQLHI